MSDENGNNIVKGFFDNYHQINDAANHPLANIYWSSSSKPTSALGCVYLIHGYGGSPIEPCMKLPMQYAKRQGFDVVALEGVDLSATSDTCKNLSEMTLERQKQAVKEGLQFCRQLPGISHSYNIAWVHSISCRALSDLMVDMPEMRNYFNEIILNNPYLLPPPKVAKLRDRLMKADPSGATWNALTKKSSTQMRNIEGQTYQIPTCLYNLFIPLPTKWCVAHASLPELARKMSHFIGKLRMHFVLGTADNMADYTQNVQFFRGLSVPNKELVSIQGANHSFENALSQYQEFSHLILDTIKQRQRNI